MPRRFLLTLLVVGFSFSLLSIFTLDGQLAPLVQSAPENLNAWHFITDFGDKKWIALTLVVIWVDALVFGIIRPTNLFWPSIKNKAFAIFTSVLAPGLAVLVLKIAVGRPRPYTGEVGLHPFILGEDFASWPSGHATLAFAFAVSTGLAYPALRWPLLALAALVGYSRMALEMHYLGDVIMGATLGTVGAVLVYNWLAPKLAIK